MARRQQVVTQMGIQVSSSVPQRLGEAVVRSGQLARSRKCTRSRTRRGARKAGAAGTDPTPPTLDWDGWIGVGEMRAYKKGVFHPGEWRCRVGFDRTLGDMGCHIFSSALSRTAAHVAVVDHVARPGAGRRQLGGARPLSLRLPGHGHHRGQNSGRLVYDGSERPPEAIAALVDGKLPDQGTVFVGTDGTLLLPHGGNEPLLYPQAKFTDRAASPTIEPRDHYDEFLDAVLASGKCSAS